VRAPVALAVMVTCPDPFPLGLLASTPTTAVVSVNPDGLLNHQNYTLVFYTLLVLQSTQKRALLVYSWIAWQEVLKLIESNIIKVIREVG